MTIPREQIPNVDQDKISEWSSDLFEHTKHAFRDRLEQFIADAPQAVNDRGSIETGAVTLIETFQVTPDFFADAYQASV